jgi:hypothetical protein
MSDLNPLSHIPELAQNTWYGWLIKPVAMTIAFMMFSYATLWMSQHYITTDKFGEYTEKQLKADEKQDQESKQRFDITQQKLETIINQQVSYTEQLKANNQVMFSIQKQVDNLDNRIIYLERIRNEHAVTPASK